MQNSKMELVHPEVINRIASMDRSWMSRKDCYYVDLFLFSYYTGGPTIADMGKFRYSEIKNDWLYDCKGRVRPMIEDSLKIVEQYQDDCCEELLLPIFTYKHITTSQQEGCAKRLTKTINQTLREVSKVLNLKEELTFSSARNIFIEHMINGRIDFNYISYITGYSVDTICRHYEKKSNKVDL